MAFKNPWSGVKMEWVIIRPKIGGPKKFWIRFTVAGVHVITNASESVLIVSKEQKKISES